MIKGKSTNCGRAMCMCVGDGRWKWREQTGMWVGRVVRSWTAGGQTGRSTVSQTLGIRTGWGLRTKDKFSQHFVPQARRKSFGGSMCVWCKDETESQSWAYQNPEGKRVYCVVGDKDAPPKKVDNKSTLRSPRHLLVTLPPLGCLYHCDVCCTPPNAVSH